MRLLIAAIFTLGFAVSALAQTQAEITVNSTYLRAAPNVGAEKLQTLQKGEKVLLEKSRDTNGWLYVSVSSGAVKGWIRKDTISEPKNTETVKPKPPVAAPPVTVENLRAPKNQTPKIQAPVARPTPEGNSSSPVAVNSSPVPTAVEAEPPVLEDNDVLVIETTEVSLIVRVVNDANRPVGNLTQDQFKIYEDDVPQPVISVAVAEIPLVNALVIDNSRSLRSQLAKVIEAGKIIVGTNRPKDETTVVRFVSSDKIEVVQEFTSDKNLLGNALDNLYVEGGQTAIIDAVYQAAKKVDRFQSSDKKEDVKLRSLILVSDGEDRGSKHSEEQLIKLLRESNVQIYAIGFINDLSKNSAAAANGDRREKAKSFLTRLAEETGGKVFFPDSIDELPKIAANISGELRTQYLISYSPTNDDKTRSFRQIKVVVADGQNQEKRTAITRTGRNVQP